MFGPPCASVYFPVFFDGDLPAAFQAEEATGCPLWRQTTRLQADRRHSQSVVDNNPNQFRQGRGTVGGAPYGCAK